jgi:acetyltransferase EpsM
MMTDLIEILVPLVNPNETEALLAGLFVSEGQKISKGTVLANFETTKSTFELTADMDGFLLGITAKEGDLIKAGTRFCFLANSKDAKLPDSVPEMNLQVLHKSAGRITKPALELARKLGVALDSFPAGTLVTEKMVANFASVEQIDIDPTRLVIYGGGGHAKSLIDLIRSEGKYQIVGVLDDHLPAGSRVLDVEVLGDGELLPSLRRKGIGQAVNAVGGIGSITPRLEVFQKIAGARLTCVTVVHPRAFIEPTAMINLGCQIFFNAYLGSDVLVGSGCIVNTGAIISHDCVLKDYVNISPGAILAGAVTVGERSLIGMGVTINLGVKIGAGARVGNSAVVKADVPENGVVRAGKIWPEKE